MALSESGQRILENLNTAVLLFDEALCLKYINTAGEILLASSTNQIIGQNIDDLLPSAEHFTAVLKRAQQNGNPYSEHELQLLLSNMQTITVDCTVTPIDGPGTGQELLMELKQLDRRLRITREENLLAQHQTTRMLVRSMAHEIKNPLAGIRGAAQLMERELPKESLKEYTQVIIGEADRLQILLDRMLGPNALPQKRDINIHEVLERVRTLVQTEAVDGIRIIQDYDPSIPEICADPDQLIQAVLNIVRNAMQALDGEGQIILQSRTERHIAIAHKHHKLVVRIDIIDNGPGIPIDMIENIFYPMITGRAEGTGLGLSIAQTLVNQNDGLIECTSTPGNTVFTLLLPLESNDE